MLKRDEGRWGNRECLEAQDAYALHRPIRKRLPRNPYTVNIMDVWECDLVDLQGLSEYNDGIKYLLNVIDVFSKLLTCRASEIEDWTLYHGSVSVGS